MTERDRLLLFVLEDPLPPMVDWLIYVQEHKGIPRANYIADVFREKLDSSSYKYRQQAIVHFREQLGIDLEKATRS